MQFLEWNALPENAEYRYDYFSDNCSTRVRDAIDRVVGGTLRQSAEAVLTSRSYRFEVGRLMAPEPALIDLPLHGLSEAQVAQLPLPAGQLDGLYRLSPMQQGMLFLGLNSPEADLYINQLCIPVQGLDPARLKDAWETVSRRHDILRTGFLWQDMAEPLQFVLSGENLADGHFSSGSV